MVTVFGRLANLFFLEYSSAFVSFRGSYTAVRLCDRISGRLYMLALIIAIVSGVLLGVGLVMGDIAGLGWSIFWGILTTLGVQVGMGLLFRRMVMARMNLVQGIIQQGQAKLQRQVQMMQTRPVGSVKQAQKMLEDEQKKFIREALAATNGLEPFFLWSILLNRQVATMRMQFNYQLQEWGEVDKLMPTCIFLEPLTSAMKMARMYTRGDDGIDAFFKKSTKRLRYGKGVILYALYSWILVKQKRYEEATSVLIDARKKVDSPVINRNWEHMANNRFRQFSNAGIGDEWYALGLETPKVAVRRQRQRGGFRQF